MTTFATPTPEMPPAPPLVVDEAAARLINRTRIARSIARGETDLDFVLLSIHDVRRFFTPMGKRTLSPETVRDYCNVGMLTPAGLRIKLEYTNLPGGRVFTPVQLANFVEKFNESQGPAAAAEARETVMKFVRKVDAERAIVEAQREEEQARGKKKSGPGDRPGRGQREEVMDDDDPLPGVTDHASTQPAPPR